MTFDDFGGFYRSVVDYYGRGKEPTAFALRRGFELVRNVPTEPLAWIADRIFREFEHFPSNLPKTLLALWDAWKSSHSEQIISEQHIECDAAGCELGWIFVRRDGYNAVATCDRCASRRGLSAGTPTNLSALLQRGWVPRPRCGAPTW